MFVPVIVPPPSPQSQELAEQIAQLVRAYLDNNPAMSGAEVDRAPALARTQLRSDGNTLGNKQARVAVFLLGLVFLLGVAISAGNHGISASLLLIATVGAAVVLGAVIFLWRAR